MTKADLLLVADTVEGCARDNAHTFESVKLGSDGLDFLEAFIASVHSIGESITGRHFRDYGVDRALTAAESAHVVATVLDRYDLTCLSDR